MRRENAVIDYQGNEARLSVFLRDNMSFAPDRKRPMVLICPGGAYAYTSEREAEPVALWYLGKGYHAAILYYSCAGAQFPTALCQLAQAVSMIRGNSGEWGVDPERIIVCGFSAGGHLALSLGTFWNRDFVAGALKKPAESLKPDGLILAYPVVTSGEYRHDGSIRNLLGSRYGDSGAMNLVSLEKQVSSDVPPVFVWTTNEDAGVPAENSLMLAMALRKAGVSVELHMYPRGAHGLSLANEELNPAGAPEEAADWINLSERWLRKL